MKLYCSLAENGWILLNLRGGRFFDILKRIKQNIHVLNYDKKKKRFLTSIYEFDRLYYFCEDNDVDLRVTKKLLNYVARFKVKRKRILKQINNTELDLELWTEHPDKQLYDYQKIGINVCSEARRFLIGDQMGVGKTLQAIGIILKAFQDQEGETALIVCPNRIKQQWYDEILNFTEIDPEDITIIDEPLKCRTGKVEKYHGGKVICKTCKEFKKCQREKNNPNVGKTRQIAESKILICHYEKVRILWQAI